MPKDKWDEQFRENQFTYGKTVNAFIAEKESLFNSASEIACFAEGEGRNAVHLAKLGHTVTAYDISPVGLYHANLLAEENDVSIQTIEADLTKDTLVREKYDGAIMVFGHVNKAKQKVFITNIINAVKSGGYVMFEVYSKDQITYDTGGPGNEFFLYDPIDILDWIKKYHCVHFYRTSERRLPLVGT